CGSMLGRPRTGSPLATALGVTVLSVAFGGAARADETSDPPAQDATLAKAKQLFDEADALRKAGDCERALPLFERSRALYPSVPNTMNAAPCLTQLGRIDEALDLEELLLARHRGELRPDELAWLDHE